jgi:hypothetical protein
VVYKAVGCFRSYIQCLLDWRLEVDEVFIGSVQICVIMVVSGQMDDHR